MTNWLGYANRTYNGIRQALLARITQVVPELTDTSENNVLIRMVNLWAALVEQLHYYLDATAREAHVATARSYRSLITLAQSKGISIPGSNPASVDIVFTLSGPAPAGGQLIPVDTGVQVPGTATLFVTQADYTIPQGQTTGTVRALQYTEVSNATANDITGQQKPLALGTEGETFYLPTNVVQGSIVMYVNGNPWTYKSTKHAEALTIASGEVFYVSLAPDTRTVVYVGDGFIGQTLAAGDVITFDYKITQGEVGNVAANTVTQIATSITPATGITNIIAANPRAASGGRLLMPLSTLRSYITNYKLTRESAVLTADIRAHVLGYADVVDANVSFEPSNTVRIALLTDNATTTPVTQIQTDLDDSLSSVLSMGLIAIVELAKLSTIDLTIRLTYVIGANVSTVRAAVTAALTEYLRVGNRTIGVPIFISDLYEVIEAVTGVQSSEIIQLTGTAQFIKVNDPTGTSNINASIQVAGQNLNVWQVTHINRDLVAGQDTYQVYIDSVYVGQVVVPTNASGSGSLTTSAGTVSINYSAVSAIGSSWAYSVAYFDGTKLVLPTDTYPDLGTITYL